MSSNAQSKGGKLTPGPEETDKTNVVQDIEKEYGQQYRDHLLEQYRLYVEMADKVSERRQAANTFFLSVNALLLSGLGVILSLTTDSSQSALFLTVFPSAAGILVSLAWMRIISSYRQLNSAKFQIIHQIERKLPLSLFKSEWEIMGRGEDPSKYVPLTTIETKVPWAFVVIYVLSVTLSFIAYVYSYVQEYL